MENNLKIGQSFEVVEVFTTKEIFNDITLVLKYDGKDAELLVNGDISFALANNYLNNTDYIMSQPAFFMFSNEFKPIGKLTITKVK